MNELYFICSLITFVFRKVQQQKMMKKKIIFFPQSKCFHQSDQSFGMFYRFYLLPFYQFWGCTCAVTYTASIDISGQISFDKDYMWLYSRVEAH